MATETTAQHTANMAMPARTAYSKLIMLAGSASALLAGLIFLAGMINQYVPSTDHLLGLLRGNWLITVFRLLTGDAGVRLGDLYRLDALDLVLLGLIAVAHAGLYCVLHERRRLLALIAIAQPPLGMLLFLLTHNAGRSAVMGAGLVMSAAMLGSRIFGKCIGWVGIMSSALLLAGDFGTGLAPNGILAVSTGIGYGLLAIWLFVIARRLVQLAR